jgi:hypothetical protein
MSTNYHTALAGHFCNATFERLNLSSPERHYSVNGKSLPSPVKVLFKYPSVEVSDYRMPLGNEAAPSKPPD